MMVIKVFKGILIPFSLAGAVLLSCAKNKAKDNSDPLPPATQVGANMMACFLDSTPWIIQADYPNTGQFLAGEGNNDTFAVAGYPMPGASFFKSIQFIQVIVFGRPKLDTPYAADNNDYIIIQYSPDSTCQGLQVTNPPTFTACSGSVTITRLDGTKRIMSGIFNAKFVIPGCDTVALSNGRFDFRF